MPTPRKKTKVEVQPEPTSTTETTATATSSTWQQTYTAQQILDMFPEPVMEPTQREYGESFYPKYKRAYDTIKQAT